MIFNALPTNLGTISQLFFFEQFEIFIRAFVRKSNLYDDDVSDDAICSPIVIFFNEMSQIHKQKDNDFQANNLHATEHILITITNVDMNYSLG